MRVPYGEARTTQEAAAQGEAGTKGLGPAECRLGEPSGATAEVAGAIEKAGG